MEVKQEKHQLFSTEISHNQCAGTGMAMVLILLIIGLYTGSFLYFKIAIPVLLLNMIVPKLFYPVAIFWFGLANVMGMIMSKVMLTLIFLLMVVPLGVIRKLMGHDAMKIKEWKKGPKSVFKDRHKTFTSEDLIHPY